MLLASTTLRVPTPERELVVEESEAGYALERTARIVSGAELL